MRISRLFIGLPLLALLAACSNLEQRQYEACIVGMTALGGAVGGGASGGSAVVPGGAVGAALSPMICGKAKATPPPPAPADSDGDGVIDAEDQCPGTPRGAAVDSRGCALDSDRDGVPDYRDRCARTPAGVSVDENGCPEKDEVLLTVERVGFAFDSSRLDAAARDALDQAVRVIRDNPGVRLAVIGHTDSVGTAAYNQGLSERRAAAVVDYLVSRGIDRSRLSAEGRGEAEPVASNDTDDGRERNRRVQLVVR